MELLIGDPVEILDWKPEERTGVVFEAVYLGTSRSYSTKHLRWVPGSSQRFDDADIAKKLMASKDFVVKIVKSTGCERYGRILLIYEKQGSVSFWIPQDQVNVTDRYDFVVISPNGARHATKNIRKLSPEEVKPLVDAEKELILDGKDPYGGMLELTGKGKWGTAKLVEVDPAELPRDDEFGRVVLKERADFEKNGG